MELTQIVGLAAGILTAGSMLPQVVKSWKEKKADEVSLKMLIVLISGIALWVVYGFLKRDMPIIFTNCFSLLVNLVMIYLRIRFADKKKEATNRSPLSVSQS